MIAWWLFGIGAVVFSGWRYKVAPRERIVAGFYFVLYGSGLVVVTIIKLWGSP